MTLVACIILTSSAYPSLIGLSNLTIAATADGQQQITQTVMISLSMYNNNIIRSLL